MSPHSKSVTITDVAARARVSVGTVSRYLNGERLREHNRERVSRAISDLSYRQNLLAKTFKTGRTQMVGTVVSGFDQFHSGVIAAMEKHLSAGGYHLIICEHEYDDRIIADRLAFLLDRRIDALIVSPGGLITRALKEYQKQDVPIVAYNDLISGLAVDSVNVNNQESARLATEHLIDLNHRNIVFVGGIHGSLTAEERKAGFLQAMSAHAVPGDDLIVESNWSIEGGYHAARKMLTISPRPTAIFSANYNMTTGILTALADGGLEVPRDMSVISFGDPDYFAAYRPAITAIRQPIEEIARNAVDLVLRRMNGDKTGFPESRRLPCELVVRGSVARVPS